MKKILADTSDLELYCCLADRTRAEGAFRALYERHSRRVYLYCLKILSEKQDAMDAFQQTFVKFHRLGQDGVILENIGGYILRIARNVCIDKLRAQKIKLVPFEEIHFSSHKTSYEEKEFKQLVEMALDLLEPEYREAFVLRELEGLSYEEITAITNDTVPALKNRVWRAKQKIRDILAPYTDEVEWLK